MDGGRIDWKLDGVIMDPDVVLPLSIDGLEAAGCRHLPRTSVCEPRFREPLSGFAECAQGEQRFSHHRGGERRVP